MQHIVIYRLRSRHRRLDDELRRELARPQPDTDRVLTLKRSKLQLKDHIARLERQGQGGSR